MLAIISTIISVAILISVGLFVYFLVYKYKINRKIINGEVTERKMTDIPKMIMIGVIIFLLIVSVINFYAYIDALRKTEEIGKNRDSLVVIDVSDKKDYKLKSYSLGKNSDDNLNVDFAYIYSEKENSGYDREVQTKGNFTFTIFKRKGPADNFHPDFLCFVENNGENNNELEYYSSVGFADKNSNSLNGTGFDSSEKKMLYIGDLNDDESFKITLSTIDREAQNKFDEDTEKVYKKDPKSSDEFPKIEDYAISSESVSIIIPE